jgi:Tol biopolymer transport system component
MKKFLIFVLFLCGCKEMVLEDVDYITPCWTPENNIIFIEYYSYQKYRSYVLLGGGWVLVEQRVKVYLWKVDVYENYRRIAKIWDSEYGFPITNTSSAGDWIVFSVYGDLRYGVKHKIYRIKRDGTGAKIIGYGLYPDLSPDGKKVVYQKKYWDKEKEEEVGQGIWIMNIDGTNDHQIVNDEKAMCPAWSSDGGRIAYVTHDPDAGRLKVIDTLGNILKSFQVKIDCPDWGPADSNALSGSNGYNGIIVYYDTGIVDTLINIRLGWGGGLRWSPSGNLFLGRGTIYKRDGTKVFTINPNKS